MTGLAQRTMSLLSNQFSIFNIDRAGASLHGRVGGQGAPLLLLHGHPQSHVMWHLVAPELAGRYTVVMMDSRGYGDSGRPQSDASHTVYSKREMALDAIAVMKHHGFERFQVLAHDTIDLDHDRLDIAARRKLQQPLRVLWGEQGAVGQCFNVLALWRERASQVDGTAVSCGHYIAEEAPAVLLDEAFQFFRSE